MVDWDPKLYQTYKGKRLRPVLELLGQIGSHSFDRIMDIGCGPATSTSVLAHTFPKANICGIDSSADMIKQAKSALPTAQFNVVDIDAWEPNRKFDLIFANAVLHWLNDHETLIGKMAGALHRHGVFAVQMPDNMDQPSHRAILELVTSLRWQARLHSQMKMRCMVHPAADYYQWLSKYFSSVNIWRTEYQQVMASHEAIVEWVKGAALRPYLSVLDEEETTAFLEDYTTLVRQSYPVCDNGSVLFPFPRLFWVAQK